ncbi:hypothetical protein F4779DRAFT_614969 [Xylariaceae sp. FL0662B]|nr:hypothetical protein F4779DRAFT_614969 [Xylariaceae sp. FL0662B]
MSAMARDPSAALMGFSVHQPAIGAPLQFFPAMGSKQLDELINAYVPGDSNILDKRAAVSMEFFEHTMASGELFKFFMVYPLGSATESPTNSMVDSGYASSFTSPVMSESQWAQQASNASFSSSQRKARHSSSKKASPPTDFSHLPGMKIMTKDGRDVTNSASRGCKTKEQRDHAHLMRIIKACDACKKKKVRCDPSHKRSTTSSAVRPAKKAKKVAAATAAVAPSPSPQIPAEPFPFTPSFDQVTPESSSSLNSAVLEPIDDSFLDWDQFVQYDEEPSEVIPDDYDFFLDPAGYFSPTTTVSSNSFAQPSNPVPQLSNSFSQLPNSFSQSQPIIPVQPYSTEDAILNTTEPAEAHVPLPPYLNPAHDVGNNYADFNLYSPGSSIDDDIGLAREVTAPRHPDYYEYLDGQRTDNSRTELAHVSHDGEFDSQFGCHVATNATDHQSSCFMHDKGTSHERSDHRPMHSHDTTYCDRSQDSPLARHRVPVSQDELSMSMAPIDASANGLSASHSRLRSTSLAGQQVSPSRLSKSRSTLGSGNPDISDTELISANKSSSQASALTSARPDCSSSVNSANASTEAVAAVSSSCSFTQRVPHVASVSNIPASSETKERATDLTDLSSRATDRTWSSSLSTSRAKPIGACVASNTKLPSTSMTTSTSLTTTSSISSSSVETAARHARSVNRVIHSNIIGDADVSTLPMAGKVTVHRRTWSSIIGTVAIYTMSCLLLLWVKPRHGIFPDHSWFSAGTNTSTELAAFAAYFLGTIVLKNALVISLDLSPPFIDDGGECRDMPLPSTTLKKQRRFSGPCADMVDLSTRHLSSAGLGIASIKSNGSSSDLLHKYSRLRCTLG